jgi:hypothetical protein
MHGQGNLRGGAARSLSMVAPLGMWRDILGFDYGIVQASLGLDVSGPELITVVANATTERIIKQNTARPLPPPLRCQRPAPSSGSSMMAKSRGQSHSFTFFSLSSRRRRPCRSWGKTTHGGLIASWWQMRALAHRGMRRHSAKDDGSEQTMLMVLPHPN